MAELRNPNAPTQGSGGGGGGDMRSMLAFTVLALGALLAFQYFKPSTPAAPAQQQQSAPASQQTQSQAPAAAPAPAAAAVNALSVVAASETETVVENELYRITFTNRGGRVKSWVLKQYHTDDDCHSAPNLFDFSGLRKWGSRCLNGSQGGQLDLVNAETAKALKASTGIGYPLELFTYEPALSSEVNDSLYQASATGTVNAPAGIIFKYSKGPITVTKTFTFNESYVVDAKVSVMRNGSPVRALVAWPDGLGDQQEVAQFAAGKFAWSVNGKHDSTGANKTWFSPGVNGNATLDQPYDYAATSDLYFTAAFMPAAPARATVVTLHSALSVPKDASVPNSEKFNSPVIGLAMGDVSGETHTRLFAGPLQLDVLGSVHTTAADGTATGEDLKKLVQFGWLKIIAEPLFLVLRWVYGFVHGWGWAIIIVTVVFNLLLLPTRVMMMRSSLKMQRVQPKLDEIKRRYAHLPVTDPKRAEMNAETMKLYKEEGINMYGSCLPMLVQMPLLYGFYRVLGNVIELRQAHWGWLPNLAQSDPMHILPIFIISMMFATQMMTPMPGQDPQQRRMMAIMMPAILGFSMWNFPSGLALYWASGNLINFCIQLAINNSSMGRELKALAAKRAAKKSLQSKTVQAKTIRGKR